MSYLFDSVPVLFVIAFIFAVSVWDNLPSRENPTEPAGEESTEQWSSDRLKFYFAQRRSF